MRERNLAMRLATAAVEALRAHGHILVAKGTTETLVRELGELILEPVECILTGLTSRLTPRAVIGEVTSTFGDEATDEAVEKMVDTVAEALMDSEHVEDIFAEDNVIRRDIFRASRDVLQAPAIHDEADEDEPDTAPISIRLDTLGYIAKAVATRADAETLHGALERVAEISDGELRAYDATRREATFVVAHGEPDARLELEEAVADELAELVELGFVDLPTIERRLTLVRELEPGEFVALKPRIDLAASRTLRRAGSGATWRGLGVRTLGVSFTPLAEEDALEVDERIDAFAAELATLLGHDASSAAARAYAAAPTKKDEPAQAAARTDTAAPAARKATAATKTPNTKKTSAAKDLSAKPAPAKKTTPAKKAAPAKKVAAAKTTPAKKAAPAKTAAKTTPAKKAAPAKKVAAAKTTPAKKAAPAKTAAKTTPAKKR